MSAIIWWIIAVAVLIGHFGLNVAIYNRVNGFGLPRKTIKRIVKFFFGFTVLLPPAAILIYGDVIGDLLRGRPEDVPIPMPLLAYSWLCLAAWPILGIPWLLWRPIFGLEWVYAPRSIEVVDVQAITDRSLALSTSCRIESRFPFNQIFDLSIEQIDLPVAGLPTPLDGYRIAQLSDVHLTGDIHPDFTCYAVQRASEWNPELMALTGDIVDKQGCIDWLDQIFASARARDGCYFVLGNHDKRIVDSRQTRAAMHQAGWSDLGGSSMQLPLRGVATLLMGNEHPWYGRPTLAEGDDADFRLLLSHSPDQLTWARQNRVTLMLAGHTHGGQGRLPLAGPILSPSFHGSRYASGDFFKPPTTMHVTRGLGGAHLVRINCRPQLSLLTLRSVPRDDGERT